MYYGFDIGGTKIEFSVYDAELNCVFNDRTPAPKYDYAQLIGILSDYVINADKNFLCKGNVGIGYPGVLDVTSNTLICPNLPSLHGHNILVDLKLRLDRPIAIQNDANCFALSECYKGAAENANIALAVTLGTGLGGAVCFNKQIIIGKNASAGEFGHMAISGNMLQRHPELPVTFCGCGGQSCLETYCSGTGLAALYKHYKLLIDGSCSEEQALLGPDIITAFESQEPVAEKVIDVYLDILAAALGNLVMLFDPDVIVFGGGLAKFSELYKQLPERITHYTFANMQLPELNIAVFGGEGGARGAALLNYKVD